MNETERQTDRHKQTKTVANRQEQTQTDTDTEIKRQRERAKQKSGLNTKDTDSKKKKRKMGKKVDQEESMAPLDELWSVMKEGEASDVGAVKYGLQRTFPRSMVKTCKPQSSTV